VQYSELTHYHLKQGSEFPNIKKLTMQILSRMRMSFYGQMRTCARKCVDRCALMRACGVSGPRACVKESEKKFRIDFSPIFDEFDVMQVG
jgi:hypothetical protein